MNSFVDRIDLIDLPGESLDLPDDPSAPAQHSPLWSALAMMVILAVVGAVSQSAPSDAEPAPTSSSDPALTGPQVEQLCRDQMLNLGIHRFAVPAYVPDAKGDNEQTALPWHPGMRVKVVPERETPGGPAGTVADRSTAPMTVVCIIPLG